MKIRTVKSGFTLVEMTVVLLVLLTLMGTGLFVSTQYGKWQMGRAASEKVRSVFAAQRQYLADHPTARVADIVAADVIPYLADRSNTLPTVETLTGAMLPIRVNVYPPVIDDGSENGYDPSGKPSDSLWDAGER